MAPSSTDKEFVTYVVELMQSIGPIHAKSMFGGYGIFLEELMFALIADNNLYLKADKETKNDFNDKDLEPFTYVKKGKEFKMSYYQAPEEALDDPNEMSVWATKAYDAALRAASKKRNIKKRT